MRLWPRINDRNPFAYLTAMVWSATIDEIRQTDARARFAGKVRDAVRRVREDAA